MTTTPHLSPDPELDALARATRPAMSIDPATVLRSARRRARRRTVANAAGAAIAAVVAFGLFTNLADVHLPTRQAPAASSQSTVSPATGIEVAPGPAVGSAAPYSLGSVHGATTTLTVDGASVAVIFSRGGVERTVELPLDDVGRSISFPLDDVRDTMYEVDLLPSGLTDPRLFTWSMARWETAQGRVPVVELPVVSIPGTDRFVSVVAYGRDSSVFDTTSFSIAAGSDGTVQSLGCALDDVECSQGDKEAHDAVRAALSSDD
jgi:hypothetical protein